MFSTKKIILSAMVVATLFAQLPTEAQADGPLRRWWRNLTGRNCATQQYVPQYTAGAVAANPYNLQPGQCMKTCQQTCSRTVVNYVPQTAYRTVYKRVPVTQYRPVTNSDPCTGCTVTCMKPCTTYTYQCQRVPYTTYRPVYRQETYKVPVTTITNDCATGNCATGNCGVPTTAGCTTCGTGVPAANFSPSATGSIVVPPASTQRYYEQPSTSYPSNYPGGSPTPADQSPTLDGVPSSVVNPQTSQRPVYYQQNQQRPTVSYNVAAPTPVYQQVNRSQPATIPTPVQFDGHTAARNTGADRQAWNYSPMRLASAQRTVETQRRQPVRTSSRWVEVE